MIDACLELKVKRLIYTSSPSVVFDGVHGIHNGNESLPYPPSVPTLPFTLIIITTYTLFQMFYIVIIIIIQQLLEFDLKCFLVLLFIMQLVWSSFLNRIQLVFQHNDHYSATKAEGEALVIKVNGTDGLLTCCIRPSSIFGPGDKLLVPSLVDAARAGKSKVNCCHSSYSYRFFKSFVAYRRHKCICCTIKQGLISVRSDLYSTSYSFVVEQNDKS